MRRFSFLLCVAAVLLLPGPSPRASISVEVRELSAGTAGPGVATSVFQAGEEFAGVGELRLGERLAYHGTRLEMPTVSFSAGTAVSAGPAGSASWSGKKTALAIVASGILPGMGELLCYTASRDNWTLARVPAFVGLDAYMWYGYFHNHRIGKDYKHDYELYAGAHWSLGRFLANHPCCAAIGGCDSWQYYNEHCQGQYNFFIYTPIESSTEEYYENIGKYNTFAFGWDDAKPYLGDAVNYQYWTPHRQYYWSLRRDSDRYLLRGDNYLMGLLVSRVVSMLDTGWLAYRISKGNDPDKGWSLRFKTYDEAPSLEITRRF
ncbi:MAG: hypothetical protein ABR899_09355 [Candidatus Krumholzibacteriaceae bacterium]|jgi:hypothetical protein